MRLLVSSIIFFFLFSPCFSLVDHNSIEPISSNPLSVFSKIKLWKGDVTELNTDSIMCSTTPSMKSDGPLNDRVLLKAGPDLKRAIKWSNEKLVHGESIIAAGFDLPAPYIHFTVPPLHNDFNELYKAYIDLLEESDHHSIKSIALTAIGTGSKRNLPADLSAKAAVQSSINYLNRKGKKYLKEIILAVYTDELFNAYKHAIQLAQQNEFKPECNAEINTEVKPRNHQFGFNQSRKHHAGLTTPNLLKSFPMHSSYKWKHNPKTCVFCNLEPSKYLYRNEKVKLLKDHETQTFKIHLLLVPRYKYVLNSILDFYKPTEEQCRFLHYMISMGNIIMHDILGLHSNQYKLEFHKPPYTTVNHLHLHLQSLPFNPPSYYKYLVSHVPADVLFNQMNCHILNLPSWKHQVDLREKIKEEMKGKLTQLEKKI